MRAFWLLALLLALTPAGNLAAQTLPATLHCPAQTGRDATLVLHVPNEIDMPTEEGWLVVSTPTTPCVGQAAWHADLRTITIHGDNPVTPEVDGARPGDPLRIELYDASGLRHDVLIAPTLATEACTACRTDFTYQHDALFVATQMSVELQPDTPTGIEDEAFANGPVVYPVYPNPVHERGTLEIGLPVAERVRISLYDLLGREVLHVHDDVLPAGRTQTGLDTQGLAGGTYLLRIEAESFAASRSLVVVR